MQPIYIPLDNQKRTYNEIIPNAGNQAYVHRVFSEEKIHDVRHLHTEMELIGIKNGSGTKNIGDLTDTCPEGDITLIGPGVPHFYTLNPVDNQKPVEAWVIQFEKNLFGPRFYNYAETHTLGHLMAASGNAVKFSGRATEKAWGVWSQIANARDIDRIALFVKLLGILSQQGEFRPYSAVSANVTETSMPSRMAKVQAHIRTHLPETLSLGELAAMAHLSKSAFCTLFKRTFNTCLTDYITENRLSLAARQLAETDLAVNEIYSQCGFTNQSYFNRRFREYFGCSPLEYRNRLKV